MRSGGLVPVPGVGWRDKTSLPCSRSHPHPGQARGPHPSTHHPLSLRTGSGEAAPLKMCQGENAPHPHAFPIALW